MDELVRQVTQRTGISEEQARTAVETVVGFLKERLPLPSPDRWTALSAAARARRAASPTRPVTCSAASAACSAANNKRRGA